MGQPVPGKGRPPQATPSLISRHIITGYVRYQGSKHTYMRMTYVIGFSHMINSLLFSTTIWRHWCGLTLVQVMARCQAHQNITLTHSDLSSIWVLWFSPTVGPILQDLIWIWIRGTRFQHNYKLLLHLSWANELISKLIPVRYESSLVYTDACACACAHTHTDVKATLEVVRRKHIVHLTGFGAYSSTGCKGTDNCAGTMGVDQLPSWPHGQVVDTRQCQLQQTPFETYCRPNIPWVCTKV